jgi:phosphatidylglycerol:prolipoprotein diacylglycerol transferase
MILINPISPVAFSIAGFGVRWYALAYIAAFVVGFWMFKRLTLSQSSINTGVSKANTTVEHCTLNFEHSKKYYDDLFTVLILGVIIGGRLGYCLFYNFGFFIAHPLEILAVWRGGMSFHGGLLGVVVSVFIFAVRTEKQKQSSKFKVQSSNNCTLHFALCTLKNAFGILDILAVVTPIGLFFGRIANFINMEVMGRATAQHWGVVFAGTGDIVPRHPSPLYEAGLEGILLFMIMFTLWKLQHRALKTSSVTHRVSRFTNTGVLSGIFAMLYAIFRFFAEQFRQPDAQLGFLAGTNWLTMGMILSMIMFAVGATVFVIAIRKK